MKVGFTLVPSVLSATPSETASGAALFVVSEVAKHEALFPACRHEYVD